MARISPIAQRYSDALFQAALTQKCLDAVDTDTRRLSVLLTTNKNFQAILFNKVVSKNEFQKVFQDISKKLECHKITSQFIALLLEKSRLDILPLCLKGFSEKVAQHNREKRAHIITAFPLKKEHKTRIQKILEDKTESKIEIKETHDPEILGGMIIKMGSFVVDSSLRTKVRSIQQSLESLG